MNKQEHLKQADYTFQRGNRELAKKYLTDFLTQYPNEESAWMLMARIVEEPEKKIACYEHVLKLNSNNAEAKIGLARIKSPGKTQPRKNLVGDNPFQASRPYKNLLRGASIFTVLVILFGTTSFVVALNNPHSTVAKLLTIPTPTLFPQNSIPDDIASQTRAEMSAKYPQYAPLVDALIGFAVTSAEGGLEGAPERPGVQIAPSDAAGADAKVTLEKALPQPGSLSSVTLTERQLTSWLAMEMKNSPDLPFSDVQVYLQNEKIQIWGMVNGNESSTSALIIGNLGIDQNKNPNIQIESIQIGTQTIPAVLVSQMESWLNQILIDKVNTDVTGLQVMNINITNGLITISGMR